MRIKSILVVEDHKPLLTAIQHVLEMENYNVMIAADGLEALQIMEQTRPDMIVADIMMPRMNGYELYEAIQTHPEWVPIPFIFLTARAEKEDLIKGKSLGVEDYIVKPFDPQELLTIVQARLGRAQAIQEASEMTFENLKRQIINTLSHELRTPLTYIQGYTTLALDESKTLDPEAFRDFLLAIKKGADRLTRLVEDMLLLVQLDTGQATEEFSALSCVQDDLSEIISRTVRQHETHASDEGIKLELQKPDTLPPIKICEIFLVEALSRLIDNAIRFSRDKGDQIIVSVQVQGEWMEIAVQDNGIGIAADQLPHLFERFRQFNREEMEQQGAGLGLSIAHELIALHSGEITVDSKPSEGSTFTIRLPLTQETS